MAKTSIKDETTTGNGNGTVTLSQLDSYKWWLSTTLLFTVSFIAYTLLAFFFNGSPDIEIILILVTAYAMGSGYRKISQTNGSSGTVNLNNK